MRTLPDNNIEVGIWYRKEIKGAISSNGKPYSITFKKGTINKLLVFFVGGGLSWNEETAKNPITVGTLIRKQEAFYVSHVTPLQLKFMSVGILNNKDKRNPFADWHILAIPYTTADFHLGNRDFSYLDNKGHERIIHHRGEDNVKQALEVLKQVVPETPETLLIAGVSAGGWGCLAHSPTIHQLYPECKQIVVCVDGSYLPTANWSIIAKNIWKINSELIQHIKSDDLISDLFYYVKKKLPNNTKLLHAMSVYDRDLVKFMNKMNNGKLEVTPQILQTFHQSLASTVSKLKKEIPNYHFYLTDYGKKRKNGTTPHVFLGNPKLFYIDMEDDLSIASWLVKATEGEATDIGSRFVENTTRDHNSLRN